MEDHPEIDVCGSWMEMFGNRNNSYSVQAEHKDIVSSLLLFNTMAHPTVMLRKTSVCKNGKDLYKKGYNCAEDYKLWTDLAMNGLHFANIPEVLLKYRCSDTQVTNIRQKEMMNSGLRIRLEYAEMIIEKIVEKEKQYENFFNELINLLNNRIISVYTFTNTIKIFIMGTSKNFKLCVMLHQQNAHLLQVNSAFASVASLDFGVFRSSLMNVLLKFTIWQLGKNDFESSGVYCALLPRLGQ
jgi:hypothetical protein